MAAPADSPILLQAIRARYGVRFGPLAALLGVSASLLGQAATNRRELPTDALLRLVPLAQALPPPWSDGVPDPPPAPEPVPALAPPLPDLPDPAALQRRLLDCEHLLRRLDREIAPLLRRQTQARHLLAVLPAFAAALPPTDARAARWLPLVEAEARAQLNPGASAALALRRARQLALRTEAAQLAAWMTGG